MIAFWVVAALLLVSALLFVVPPLFRHRSAAVGASQREITLQIHRDQLAELERDFTSSVIDQTQYDKTRAELERRVLEETAAHEAAGGSASGRWVALLVALLVPAIAVPLYLKLGSPQALDAQALAQAEAEAAGKVTPQQIESMVQGLADKLKQNPDDNEGWLMLARSYVMLQHYDEAAKAYAELDKRMPNEPQVLADWADALAMAKGRSLAGEPERLITKALALDPNNLKALAMAGSLEFDQQAYAKAVEHWQRILNQVPPDSEIGRSVQSSIAEARQRGGLAAAPNAAAAPAAAASGPGKVSGHVALAPALSGKVGPDDTVFVFARAAQGPRMPLAILRKQVKDLPLQFALDDSMAMSPDMKLSNFPQIVVGARISKSGNAMPQKGDLEGLSRPLTVGSQGVDIVIDNEVN